LLATTAQERKRLASGVLDRAGGDRSVGNSGEAAYGLVTEEYLVRETTGRDRVTPPPPERGRMAVTPAPVSERCS
jgi:hypothetical protein